jgi:acyl-CoA thioester hydrolase
MRLHETRLKVRFTEVDLYEVVWHGHYLNWFEVSRNELAGKFELDPLTLREAGFLAPVVEVHCQFKEPARPNDELVIRTGMQPSELANLIFTYEVLHAETNRVLATGRTVHVLTDSKGTLLYRIPEPIQQRIGRMMEYLEVEP